MAITPLTVTIDLNPSYKKIPAVYVSQLDNNLRSLAITVQDGGVNYDVASSGYDVYVEGTKPDKHGFSYKVTDIGGTVVGSVVTVPMQTQMTCVQGMVPTEIVLKSGADRIGSANFLLVVERAGLAEDVDVSETDIPAYIDGAQQAAAAAAQSADDAEDAKDLAVAAKDTAVSVAASIPEDYTTLSNDVDDLKSALYGENIYQYLNSALWIANSLWHNSGESGWTTVGYANVNGYHRYPALHLEAGTYSITKFYAIDSYIKYDNDSEVYRFSAKYPPSPSTNSYAKTFTTTDAFTIYITVKDADSNYAQTMIVNDGDMPTDYKDAGIYKPALNRELIIGDHTLAEVDAFMNESEGGWIDKYIYAYIHDSMLVGNSNKGAKYTQVDMGSKVQKMMCRYKLRQTSNGNTGCVTLITLPSRDITDAEPVNDIGAGSVHVTFTPVNAQVGVFVNHALSIVETISYASLTADETTEYQVGIEFTGSNTLKVYLPTGATQNVTDSRIDANNGQYIIFEHYTQNYAQSDYPTVTEQMPQPLMTGFYCKAESTVELRDNFHREDGAIGTAPSGQVYRSFVNRASGSSIYDEV